MERLDPRVRYVWGVGVIARGLLVGIVATSVLAAAVPRWLPAGVGLAGLYVALGLVHTVYRYRRWRYELQDDALYIERGVITHVRTVVPYVRVQHVDTQRGPTERLVDLSRVVVYTAGSRRADVTVPGLMPNRADALQERLRRLAIESEPEDAV